MDDILQQGARRESRSLVVLGAILLGGGLACTRGFHYLGIDSWVPKGAVAAGALTLLRGLFGGSR